jgi:hypothetical protein
MATLVGVLVLSAPFVTLATVLLVIERRQRRRTDEIRRQIALTDALHARLGALVAPVVRRRLRVWQVLVAVPVERPAVLAAVLEVVDRTFERGAYEVVLRRQASPARSRSLRPATVGGESLSWT